MLHISAKVGYLFLVYFPFRIFNVFVLLLHWPFMIRVVLEDSILFLFMFSARLCTLSSVGSLARRFLLSRLSLLCMFE
jgi:hypothetical protein